MATESKYVAKTVTIKHGKFTYKVSRIRRKFDGQYFYLVKRTPGTKKLFGQTFDSYRDMYNHYPSIQGELKKHFGG